MEKILDSIVGFLWGLPLIITILFTGFYFTFGSKFFQFRYFGHIMSQTFFKLFQKSKEEENVSKGIISPLEAVSTAIGGSVGVGNMGGVATAIAVGGPGAVFWMWLMALIGMLIKTAEVTLAVYYRNTDEEGNPYGGPTYYMEKGLGEERNFKFWIIPAIIFGLGIFSTFPITLQNYTVSEAVSSTFNISMVSVAIVYVIVNYFMILGGIKHLGKIASKIVPIMCLFYILSALFIILKNASLIPSTFALIFSSAFKGTAAIGGFAGVTTAQVIRLGISRSVFSNEAGWGTSPMIHSTAKTDHPIKQGLWGGFEVFIDTMVVCTVTALLIIITGEWSSGLSGATLTLTAFESGVGTIGRQIVAIGTFLFGITTSSGWYSYYEIILRHSLKEKVQLKNNILKFYKAIYPFPGLFMVLYAVKNGLPGKYVWYFADITSAIPTFANVFAILLLSGTFFKLLKDYKARYLGIGKVDPNFRLFYEDLQKSKSTHM
ncbi:alanine/glycine:cation symporter family protein [Inediibacterium massiliense]|uniref:alanine/glycine:cation symporter family protein n=1 Tax=Inediibacterium massiliense TaxID=1658111 RepID=UPI0006B588BB|nr:sodium:alanine symporter family protein [Inediibacterium massiliense]